MRSTPPLLVAMNVGSELACALTTALDPWGIKVVGSRRPSPGSSMPSTAEAARSIAVESGARAVVWLGQDAAGFALWVYDSKANRTVARPAPEPPYEASVAAALALKVKTIVRMVGLAPKSESPPVEPPPAK